MTVEARIDQLEGSRRKNKREAARARKRARAAALKGDRKGWREANQVARNNNREAQEDLEKIRILRANRKKRRAAARLLRHRRSAGKTSDGRQLYWFDGVRVTGKIYPWLVKARKKGWRGHVTSGYRTPAYSMQLCWAMCGRPSCPGRCAGTSSNHVRDAVDLTDYVTFARIMREEGNPIYNALGWRDPVHFSPNGH